MSTRRSPDCHPAVRRGIARSSRVVRALFALLLMAPHLTGCFSYAPVSVGAAPNGVQVSISLTDRGRHELAEPVGPGVRRIDGRLLANTDTSLVLAVETVQFHDLLLPMRWEGARLEVANDLVAELRERRLSRSRTGIAAGFVILGAIAASTIAISGFGSGGEPRPPTGNGDQQ